MRRRLLSILLLLSLILSLQSTAMAAQVQDNGILDPLEEILDSGYNPSWNTALSDVPKSQISMQLDDSFMTSIVLDGVKCLMMASYDETPEAISSMFISGEGNDGFADKIAQTLRSYSQFDHEEKTRTANDTDYYMQNGDCYEIYAEDSRKLLIYIYPGAGKTEPAGMMDSSYADDTPALDEERYTDSPNNDEIWAQQLKDVHCYVGNDSYSTQYQWDIPVYKPEIEFENCTGFTISLCYNEIPDSISLGKQRVFCKVDGYFKELTQINVEELGKEYTMDISFDKPVKIEGFAVQPAKNPRSGYYDQELRLLDVQAQRPGPYGTAQHVTGDWETLEEGYSAYIFDEPLKDCRHLTMVLDLLALEGNASSMWDLVLIDENDEWTFASNFTVEKSDIGKSIIRDITLDTKQNIKGVLAGADFSEDGYYMEYDIEIFAESGK